MSYSRSIKTFLLIVCCLVEAQFIFSQQFRFEHIRAKNGLSQNSVVDIIEDSSGFIWFATQDGLNRYDGTNFLKHDVFFKDITESEYSQLGNLYIDKHERLWLTTLSGGLEYFDSKSNEFKVIDGLNDASSVFQPDSSQFLISSFTDGLYQMKFDGSSYRLDHLIKGEYIKKIVLSKNILLLTNHGVIDYNLKTKKQKRLFKSLGHVSDLVQLQENEIIFSTSGNKLFHSDSIGNYQTFLELPKGSLIQDLHIDISGKLWIATRGEGLFLYHQNKLKNFKTDPLNPHSISYDDVLCVFEDSQNNIWFGTDGGGVSFLVGNHKPIQRLTNSQMPKNIPVDVPRALSTDRKGNLWIGTSGKGLTKTSKDLKVAKLYSTNEYSEHGLTSDRIMCLHHDELGDLWIGTQEGGLLKKEQNLDRFQKIENGFPAMTIWDIKEADQNTLWICSRASGLLILDKHSLDWKKLGSTSDLINFDKSNIRVICEGEEGQYFFGTEDGKVYEVLDFKIVKEVSFDVQEPGPIKSLLLDQNKLWIGSQKSGIIIIDFKNKKQWHLDKSNGLPNNVIYSILPQNEHSIWISTNLGICQIDKKKLFDGSPDFINQHLSVNNGLVSNEFNTGAHHIDNAGTLYFGGIDGVNWFDPNAISKDTTPLNIVLLDLITVGKEGQETTDITDKNEIELQYPIRNFQLRYVAQSYAPTSEIKYKYMLEGINEDWVENENNELVSFSNIPPGDYIFKIKSTNGDGVWSTYPTQLSLKIIPTFWQTWWFKVLAILASISLLWYLYYIRVTELKRTSDLKGQLSAIEAKALKLQMNPHFLFNSLNAIDNYILKNEKIKASDYLSKFSKLIRQILEYSEQSQISLSQELKTLELYINLEQLRFQKRFDYQLNVQEEVDTDKLNVPPLILQPFVENAIWHGLMHLENDGELKIDIVKRGDFIKCIIDDNGIGRKHAEQIKTKSATKHKSFGMSITEKRLSLNNDLNKINATISIHDKENEDGSSAGTAIEIKFPLQTV